MENTPDLQHGARSVNNFFTDLKHVLSHCFSDPYHSSVTINHSVVTKQRASVMENCFTRTYALSLIFTAKGLRIVRSSLRNEQVVHVL